eukprot:4197640-Alexandrium_andersonii.AAC.1
MLGGPTVSSNSSAPLGPRALAFADMLSRSAVSPNWDERREAGRRIRCISQKRLQNITGERLRVHACARVRVRTCAHARARVRMCVCARARLRARAH